MYTNKNYRTKKELVADVKAGKEVGTFQPGPFPAQTEGRVVIEGPQYPEPHKWYASAILKDGIIIDIK